MSEIGLERRGEFVADTGHAGHVPKLDMQAVSPPSGLRGLGLALAVVGAVMTAVTLVMAMTGEEIVGKQGSVVYLTGVLFALSIAIGSMGLNMIWHQMNAGWCATVRRPLEHAGALVWLCGLMFIPMIALAPKIYHWMHGEPDFHGNVFKQFWLDPSRWWFTIVAFFVIWSLMGWRLLSWSRQQDRNGDRWLTARARRLSAVGLIIFALTTAFIAFDTMMSMDKIWFSTMFGVKFFAGSMLATLCTLTLVLTVLKKMGKLKGVVTDEHFHDLGKLVLAFVVFWAYISFSEYFLIWYSNIPEETAWFKARTTTDYKQLFILLALGHFLVPFVILLLRKVKKVPLVLSALALWLLVMHGLDLVFITLPTYPEIEFGANAWLTVLGVAGPPVLFIGALLWRMQSGPLVPVHEPRLNEALTHKHYV